MLDIKKVLWYNKEKRELKKMPIAQIKKFISELEQKRGNWTPNDFEFYYSLTQELRERTKVITTTQNKKGE